MEMSQQTKLPQDPQNSQENLEEDTIVVATAKARWDGLRGRTDNKTANPSASPSQPPASPALPDTTSALPTLDRLTIKTLPKSNGRTPQPRNSFILYRRWAGLGNQVVAARWSAEDPAVKQHFEHLAAEEKTRRSSKLAVEEKHRTRFSLLNANGSAGTSTGDAIGAYNAFVGRDIATSGSQQKDEQHDGLDISTIPFPSPEELDKKTEMGTNNAALNKNVSSRRPKKRVRFSSPEVMADPRSRIRADRRKELLAKLSTPIADALKAQPQEFGDEDDSSQDEANRNDDEIDAREARYIARHNNPAHRAARIERETDLAMPTASRGPGSSPRKYKSVIRSFVNRGTGMSIYFHTAAEYDAMPRAMPREQAAYRSHDTPKPRLTFSGFPTMEVPGGYYSPGVDAYWESFLAEQARKAKRGEISRKTYTKEETPLLWTMYVTKNDFSHYIDETEEANGKNKKVLRAR